MSYEIRIDNLERDRQQAISIMEKTCPPEFRYAVARFISIEEELERLYDLETEQDKLTVLQKILLDSVLFSLVIIVYFLITQFLELVGVMECWVARF